MHVSTGKERLQAPGERGRLWSGRGDLGVNPEVLPCAAAQRIGPEARVVSALTWTCGGWVDVPGAAERARADAVGAGSTVVPKVRRDLEPRGSSGREGCDLVIAGGQRHAAVGACDPSRPGRTRPRRRTVVRAHHLGLRADVPDRASSRQRRCARTRVEPDAVQSAGLREEGIRSPGYTRRWIWRRRREASDNSARADRTFPTVERSRPGDPSRSWLTGSRPTACSAWDPFRRH